MSRADRILLCLAYLFLVVIAVVGIWRVQTTVESAVDRTCDVQKVQLKSLQITLQNVQLADDTKRDELIAEITQLRDDVRADCP